MKLLEIWNRLGKQPLKSTKYQEAKVFIDNEEYVITRVRYESGKFIGFEAVKKCCKTCKNHNANIPHTCDICTSLDQNEEYSIWEVK